MYKRILRIKRFFCEIQGSCEELIDSINFANLCMQAIFHLLLIDNVGIWPDIPMHQTGIDKDVRAQSRTAGCSLFIISSILRIVPSFWSVRFFWWLEKSSDASKLLEHHLGEDVAVDWSSGVACFAIWLKPQDHHSPLKPFPAKLLNINRTKCPSKGRVANRISSSHYVRSLGNHRSGESSIFFMSSAKRANQRF